MNKRKLIGATILAIIGISFLKSCRTIPKGATAVKPFSIEKYLGKWYEIARLDFRFERNLKVTIQDLGWRSGGRYLVQQSDISSVVYWYQTEPHHSFPKLPTKDELEEN